MRHVEFTRIMQPYQAGDRRVLPDELALKLFKEDSAKDLGAFPDAGTEKPAASEVRARRYITRSRA